MRFFNKLAIFASIACFSTQTKSEPIEVMHFWVSAGEANAINVFAKSYRDRGFEWYEDAQANEETLRAVALKRIREGYPPTAVQWLVSPNIGNMINENVARPIEEIVGQDLLARVHPIVLDALRFEGHVGAVPVGIHGNNWSYFNADIMQRFGFAEPKSWDEFFDQMQAIEDAGLPTIAIGSGAWERGLVLDTLLLAGGGGDLLTDLRNGNLTDVNEAQVEQAFGKMIRFVEFVRTSGIVTDAWNTASLAVAHGDASVQIMGDWAKGELTSQGFAAGSDFLCSITPGSQTQYLLSIDAFVLPRSDLVEDQAAQAEFVRVILNSENQAEFSTRKGALPVVNDVDLSALDVCGRRGLEAISNDQAIVKRVTRGANPALGAAVSEVLDQIWKAEVQTGRDATKELRRLFKAALNK